MMPYSEDRRTCLSSAVIFDPMVSELSSEANALAEARAALAGDIAVLLGAGASVEAGIPASIDMTNQIVKAINADPMSSHNHQAWALNFVCGALTAHQTARGESYLRGLDIEFVASAVDLLADRHEHEASPFVSAWHPAVEEIDLPAVPPFFDGTVKKALGAGASSIEAMIQSASRNRLINGGRLKGAMESGASDLTHAIQGLIDAKIGHGTGRIYRNLQSTMISHLCDNVRIEDPGRTRYLINLIGKARTQSSLVIGTLNYDRSIEMACAAEGIACTTGIQDWSASRIFPSVNDGIQLLKLHGSIDWHAQYENTPTSGHLRTTHVIQSDSMIYGSQPLLIFGRREKLRASGPFLDLLREWETKLRAVDILLVVGYSFRDDHINETIRRWINDGTGRQIFVIDPSWSPGRNLADDFRCELEFYLVSTMSAANAQQKCLHVIKEGAGKALDLLFAS